MKNPNDPLRDHLNGWDDIAKIREKTDKQRRDADRNSNIALAVSILALAITLLSLLPSIVEALSLPR